MARRLRAGSALPALALAAIGATGGAFLATPAAAQDYTNVTASGRVTDTAGKPIAGAKVVARSNDLGIERTVTTDSSGSYKVVQIPPGSYTFSISAPGLADFVDSNVSLRVDASGNDFQLGSSSSKSASGGDIVVTGRRVKVADFERTTTGAVINVGDLATRVPVARSLRDVILLAPGTTQGSSGGSSAFAGQAQISGSSFTENAYYVNGLNITDVRQGFSPVTIPFDFYQTVDIKTGGFPAEYGRASGGFVSATTKSGTNEFHGSLTFNYEPNGLKSKSPNTYLIDYDGVSGGTAANGLANRKETIAQLSGPIIKDHLFFYGLYNTRDVSNFQGSANATVAANNTGTYNRTTSPFWGGKIDAIPFNGQHLEFTYFDTSGSQLNQTLRYNNLTNAKGAVTGTTNTRYGGKNYVARYTGTLTKWLTVSGAYGVNKNRAGVIAGDTVNPRVIDNRTGSNIAVAGTNPVSSFTTNDDQRKFYRGDVDIYFNLLGSHHIKFGYDQEDVTSVQNQVPIGGGLETVLQVTNAAGVGLTGQPIGTQYVTQRFFSVGGAFKSKNQAYYLQDSWQLFQNRLTLQLGIRDDKFASQNGLGQSFFKGPDSWGPRLGASYDVLGDGKIKVYGSFSRYFDPVPTNTNIRGSGTQFDRTAFYFFNGFNGNGGVNLGAPILTYRGAAPCPDTGIRNCQLVSQGTAPNPNYVVAQGAKPQSEDEFILGGEWRFAPRWTLGISGKYRRLTNALEDAAVDQFAIAYCQQKGFSAAACNSLYSGFADYIIVNPGKDNKITLSSNGGAGLPDGTNPTVTIPASQLDRGISAKRYYREAIIKVDREFDGVWSLSGSYTWSKLTGNYEGGAKSDIGQPDTGITEDFDQPGFTYGAYGLLPGDRRHTIKLYGSYAPFDWLTLSGNVLLQSPKHFSCLGVVPTSVDPFANVYGAAGFFCGGVVSPRGSVFHTDWRKEVNLSVKLNVPAKFDAFIRLDVFNVFNFKSVLEAQEVGETAAGAPSQFYKLPLTYQNPRYVRIQIGVGF
nr:TonB-dependent receptor [Sphingomonas vulcanisoli]